MIEVKEAPPSVWTDLCGNIYSQHGEDGILAELFRRIGTTNKQCLEVGAADGKWFSNARWLIDQGWSAVLIEADERNWPTLDKLDDPPRVNVVHGKAEPAGANSIDAILRLAGFSDRPDLVVIDVDGQDYYLFNGMVRTRPRVVVVEFDPIVDPTFLPELDGKGQAGFHAILSVAAAKGYVSVATTPTNAIFIDAPLKKALFDSFADTAKPLIDNRIETRPPPPVIETPKEVEVKIAAVLSRPRFGLNSFWDCVSEALPKWGIPIQSFYGVFWGQCMQKAFEDNLDEVDWILTLDYDSMFTSKHMQMLIDTMGANPGIDALAALQPRRGRPLPLAVHTSGQMTIDGAPQQVTTAHFGLTLLRTASIRKMKKPWFMSKPAEDGSWGEGRLDDDIYFWGNWRDSGNNLFVHTGCKLGHCEEMVAQYNAGGEVEHVYLSQWKKDNGFYIKSFE